MIVGVAFGVTLVIILNANYVKKLDANNGIPVPEWRMPLPMFGGVAFAAGLFWLGWTGYTKSIHWIVPSLAGLLLGFGIYTVFLQCLNYIIDAYLMFAASVSLKCLRALYPDPDVDQDRRLRRTPSCGRYSELYSRCSVRGRETSVYLQCETCADPSTLPSKGTYMFNGIGINWGLTLLGLVATLFIPMPFVFYVSRWALARVLLALTHYSSTARRSEPSRNSHQRQTSNKTNDEMRRAEVVARATRRR